MPITPAAFVHSGEHIDHTPSSTLTAGAVVVQGELVGIVKTDIPANTLGSIAVSGVFDFPKATGSSTARTAGQLHYWDAGAQLAVTTANSGANKLLGPAIAAAADGDATVRIRLRQ